MGTQLRVLMVEDSEDDARLSLLVLEGAYSAVEHQRVDTEASMREALASKPWDVILLDYSLPGFDASQALEIARAHDRDLPVILVSGLVGEATAVKMMRQGVRDYVLKDSLTLLPPAVAREQLNAEAARERRRAVRALRESEERLHAVVANVPVVQFALDREGIFTLSEGKGLETLGLRPGEVVGLSAFEVYADSPDVIENLRRVFAGESIRADVETSGQVFDSFWSPVFDSAGEVAGLVGVSVNITDRVRAEQALRESEERFRGFFENAVVGIDTTRVSNGTRLDLNDALARILGYRDREELMAEGAPRADQFTDIEERRRIVRELREAGAVRGVEVRARRRDGTPIWLNMSGRYVPETDTFEGVHLDITDRKRAEQALRESEERFRTVIETAQNGIVLFDVQGRATLFNDALCRMLGYTRAEMESMPLAWVLHPDEREAVYGGIAALSSGDGPPGGGTLRLVRKDGKVITADIRASVFVEGGEPAGSLVEMRDVTEELALQRRLAETAAEVTSILEVDPDAVILSDEQGVILRVNPAACVLFGWSERELMGRNVSALAAEPHRDGHDGYMRHYIETGEPSTDLGLVIGTTRETVGRRKDGTEFPIELSVAEFDTDEGSRRYTAAIRDLTDSQQLKEQLLVAQKSEALATLVSGVAHDFNNLLTIIHGGIEFAQTEQPDSRWLENAGVATDRATELVRRLLRFARRDAPRRAPVSLVDVTESVAVLARETFDRRVSLDVNVAEGASMVFADASQIEQVAMNLLVNARDAVVARLAVEPESAGYEGRIAITVGDCDLPTCACGAGRCVRLAVSDNGTGMSPEVRKRAFDPFFTTKDPGAGTGLGLSTAYGIVADHGGALTVVSEAGEGTTFSVELPVAVEAATAASDAASSATSGAASSATSGAASAEPALAVAPGGTKGSVLLVDDEPLLLVLADETLTREGYEVVAVPSGHDALREIRERRFDLALVDVAMPAPDGWDVLAGIQESVPGLRVVMASGHALRRQVEERGAAGFLEKPYGLRALLRAVETHIGKAAGDGS